MADVTAGSFATTGVEDQLTAFEPDAVTVEAVIASGANMPVALAKLENGVFGGVNENTGLTIYGTNLAESATGTMGDGDVSLTASDDAFYALQIDTSVWTLRQFDENGTQDDVWDGVAGLPSAASDSCSGIGIKADGTILYYVCSADVTKVFSFTLATDTDNGALVTRALFAGGPILVLPDGTLLVGWFDIATATTFDVKHYAANGSTLHTYSNIWGPMALNLARTSTSFWIADTVSGDLKEITVSSGATATTLTPDWDITAAFIVLDAFIAPVGETRYIRRLRRFPLPFDMNKYVFISRIEFLFQSGVGLISGQGSDPIVMVRFSKDGGQTWGLESQLHIGEMGQYEFRCYLNRPMGAARNPVCEMWTSDPVPYFPIACWVDMELGSS